MKEKREERPVEEVKPQLEVTGFAPLDPAVDGVEVGFAVGTKLDFANVGERIVGVLMQKKQVPMKDQPWCYSVYNAEGAFWFWGSTVLNGRLKAIKEGTIVDIIFDEKRPSPGAHDDYKVFTVKVYNADKRFDPLKFTVGIDKSTGMINYYKLTTPLPDVFQLGHEGDN